MSFLTPETADLLRAAIESYLTEMHICLPGQIVSYDKTTGLAKVKPLLMKKVANEANPREMGIISNVPVVFPRAGAAVLRLPVAAGTLVTLHFSERSLDRWLNDGGVVDPAINTKFHYNDAIAVPGLYPGTQPPPQNGADSSLEIAVGTNYIEIKADGSVIIKNATSITFDTGQLIPASGVVTGQCLCAFTGSVHPDVSASVKASK